MAKKKSLSPASRIPTPSPLHRIETLLHTMRCIAQYEDILCELSHEIRTVGGLTREVSAELRNVVDMLPLHDYVNDVESLRVLLKIEPPKASSLKKKQYKAQSKRIVSSVKVKAKRKSSK
jgi:hypothetical protein